MLKGAPTESNRASAAACCLNQRRPQERRELRANLTGPSGKGWHLHDNDANSPKKGRRNLAGSISGLHDDFTEAAD